MYYCDEDPCSDMNSILVSNVNSKLGELQDLKPYLWKVDIRKIFRHILWLGIAGFLLKRPWVSHWIPRTWLKENCHCKFYFFIIMKYFSYITLFLVRTLCIMCV